ncbi:PAS domain-containing protein [Patulibacter sp. NPDC049589]|uniref:PAS domain-containing protein n=1 Tax=Patulibacter sp. NPDC049589 TaxID=3154731 RepID=UPI00342487A7
MTEGPIESGRGERRRAGSAPELLSVLSAGLTRDDVEVVLRPVSGPTHAATLTAAIERIGGVAGTSVSALAAGELRIVVRVARPVSLGSELRRVLHRRLRTCAVMDGRFHVQLDSATVPAEPAAPESAATPGENGGTPDESPADHTMDTVPGPLAQVARPAGVRPAAAPRPAAQDPDAPAADVMVGALRSMTDVSMLVFDADLRFRGATGTAHEQHGYTPDQLVGRSAPEALTPRDWHRFQDAYRAAVAGRTTVLEFRGADETVYEYTCSPVLHRGAVVGGMVVTRDVTALRRDQLLLSELQEVFELTFDHSPICQALLSPDGRWLRVNRALGELLGRAEPALVGREAHEVTHPEDRRVEQELVGDLVAGRRDRYALQKRLVRADGSAVPVHVRMSAVRSPAGGLRGLIAQILDDEVLTRAPAPRAVR